jgi:flagellar hook-associated protein 1 FlgK
VTAQNIANAQTPGYARRRVLLSAQANDNGVIAQTPWRGSRGVLADRVERMRDEAAGRQLQRELAHSGRGQALADMLGRAEAVFSDLQGTGLSSQLGDLFRAFSRLGADSESLPTRRQVLQVASTLTDTLHEQYANLSQVQREADTEVQATVEQVNRLTAEVASYNARIAQLSPEGQADTLLDVRDQALEQLAELVGAEAVPQEGGMVDVIVQGRRLVTGTRASSLSLETNPPTGFPQPVFADGSGLAAPQGKLGGLLAARDQSVPRYLAALDDLADNLRDRLNALHQTGVGLDGSTSLDFFVGSAGATGLAVNPALLAAPQKLGASATGAAGDGARALDLAALGDALTMSGGLESFAQFYAGLVAGAGSDSAAAQEQRDASDTMVAAVRTQQQSVEGVSLDEEAVNLIRYQQAYAAAARVVQTTREMMQTLLEMGQ